MSEVRELPHEVLLRRYGLNISQLSNHTQQLKKDLDKTITFLVNKSKNGKINLTPAVESKIETYDRYICDGIFEFLENKDVITEAQADALKDKADDAREKVIDDLGDDDNDSNDDNKPANKNTDSNDSSSQSNSTAKIGFWDWN
jgi:hypothetical protein